MTKLFQIVEAAGLLVDSSNDELSTTDDGFVWEVPIMAPPYASKAGESLRKAGVKPTNPDFWFPHIWLIQAAVSWLGDDFRGYVYHPCGVENDGNHPSLHIYLAPSYTEN